MRIRTLSSGVVVIRRERGEWRFLLLRAYQYWDFPKGGVERGETPFEAALREVQEETGITELAFHWGHDFIETGPYARGKVARYHLAETTEQRVVMGISEELGRPEHHEYRWVSLAQAQAMCAPRVQRVLDWARKQLDLDPPHRP
ncbi:bis(5'-nucleosyl)-tetraphosphatase [Alkalilimnicola sp. S0819]|uniref:bis(5'-nucleosyl)-tetraphosphatase n=1 Tax=Alkalilimnicola sp. S0819 TaxID=2613922 RepID=UPI00126244EC|nr:NUDIX domain-containing protein [Alkalilimnicola sp. S0819]KAB7624404.1 NUDIX domain-containing protein [Alkalilimnicola sp. S0819]MPQ16231.1 NUDIX domain-containing protein [Alkalilimnicola sp. S0819]